MSMNLTCEDNEKSINLWQTPTHITWMCLSYNPETKESDGGEEGVRRRYILWVESHKNGVWQSTEELADMRESILYHVAEIQSIEDPKFSYV